MLNRRPESIFDLLDILKEKGVHQEEYWKYITTFLENKARRLHIPIHGNFELTPLCNFNCKMCYVHLSNEQFDTSNLLQVTQWMDLANQAQKAGMRSVTLTGGECLTYPGFDELYTKLVLAGLKVGIQSNGYYINEKHIKLFEKYSLSGIRITLYGSNNDSYESVTGVRAFTQVYNNILKLRDAGLDVTISITPNSYSGDDIIDLIDLVEEMHIHYEINPWLMTPRENTGRKKDDLSMDNYLKIYHHLSEINHKVVKPVDWNDIPEENHSENQCFGVRCGAGRSAFGIKYDGSMCPCLSLDDISFKPLIIGFEKAWHQINVAVESYPIPLECGDCVFRMQCLSCIAIHKKVLNDGHCDPMVCKRVKLLVKEGFISLQNSC